MKVKQNPIQEIKRLFAKYGHQTYGEGCSQSIHAISCATHAKYDGANNELIVAALLHDIGHFIAEQNQVIGFDQWGHAKHAEIGADWLKELGFPASVYLPIRYHVQAKRYLLSQNKEHVNLSLASSITLKQQGGVMTKQEIVKFESSDCFIDALKLRKYDDLGKPTTPMTNDMIEWFDLVEHVLKG